MANNPFNRPLNDMSTTNHFSIQYSLLARFLGFLDRRRLGLHIQREMGVSGLWDVSQFTSILLVLKGTRY